MQGQLKNVIPYRDEDSKTFHGRIYMARNGTQFLHSVLVGTGEKRQKKTLSGGGIIRIVMAVSKYC